MIDYFLSNYDSKDIILEVDVNNNSAIRLYEKFGFSVISTRKKYYNGNDAYVMKRVVK